MSCKNIMIIGAGGVTSYLLRPLILTFKPESITIWDGDKLEKRNLERQLFKPEHVGQNKAKALCHEHRQLDSSTALLEEEQFFMESSYLEVIPDLIICCADNHEARKNTLLQSDTLQIPCLIGGNEFFDSEAYIYFPDWKDTPRDPRIRYPSILTSTEGSPLHCDTEAALNSTPQLAIANMTCASILLRLLWLWEKCPDITEAPFELFHGKYEEIRCTWIPKITSCKT